MGGILHPRLNICKRPIEHKYLKGKLQRTLERELKELEIVEMDAIKYDQGCKFNVYYF